MDCPKRVVAIHDISGFGKCSLTVALPILSASGIETSVIPTAVLSTHTGGFDGYTYRDLSGDMLAFAQHWKSLGLTFDAFYSGFLGSYEQLEIVGEIFDMLKTDGDLVLVDPVMGDKGNLYSVFDSEFPVGMRRLVAKADIIVPNMTEAFLLLGEAYREAPYTAQFVENLLVRLSGLGPQRIVLTGVCFDDKRLGAATYDGGKIDFVLSERVPGFYHGTGDIFASVLLATLLNGADLCRSAKLAVDFVTACVRRTYDAGVDVRYGVRFEQELVQWKVESFFS